jgi:DNA-binding transcriptional ArsR family regulator
MPGLVIEREVPIEAPAEVVAIMTQADHELRSGDRRPVSPPGPRPPDQQRRGQRQVAGPVPFSRQAVSKHLVMLWRAGLVSRRKQGREVMYQVEANGS